MRKQNGVKSSLEESNERRKPNLDRAQDCPPPATNQGLAMRRNPLVPAPSMGRNLVHLIHGEPNKPIQSHPDLNNQIQNCPADQKNQARFGTNQSKSVFNTPPRDEGPQNGTASSTQSSEKTKGFQDSNGHISKRAITVHPVGPTSDYENLSDKRGNQGADMSTNESKGRKIWEPAFVVQVERESTNKVSQPQIDLYVVHSFLFRLVHSLTNMVRCTSFSFP